MNYKTELQSNNADLAAILNTVNALPEATEPKEPVIEGLNVTANGIYTAPDGVDGYSPVTVNVPVPDGYIIPTGTLEITENGTHDVTEYASVDVNVASGGGFEDELLSRSGFPTVYINTTAEKIGPYAFYAADIKIVKLMAVKSATGGYVFNSCKSLTEIHVPNFNADLGSVWAISCPLLELIDMGQIDDVPSNAFRSNAKFNKLILRRNGVSALKGVAAFDSTPFASGGTGGTVYVPQAQIESYKTATNWSVLYGQGTCTFLPIEGSEYE